MLINRGSFVSNVVLFRVFLLLTYVNFYTVKTYILHIINSCFPNVFFCVHFLAATVLEVDIKIISMVTHITI